MRYPHFKLISHRLCPFVQRAAITLEEKGVPFERVDIDLANKPDWFLKLSPLGKVPVLVVDDDTVLFESSVIAQYLDEVTGGELLSRDPLEKARELAWMEFASNLIGLIGNLYSARTASAFELAAGNLRQRFETLEAELGDGPWFGGDRFSLVDAAFAPAFRYFEVIDRLIDSRLFASTPRLARWRDALAARPSVAAAVSNDYADRLLEFLAKRDSVVGRAARIAADAKREAAA